MFDEPHDDQVPVDSEQLPDTSKGPVRRNALPVVIMALCVAGWLMLPPWLYWSAAISSAPFFGEQPGPERLAAANTYHLWAVITAVGFPAIAAATAAASRRHVAAGVFSVMLAASGVLTAWAYSDTIKQWYRDHRDSHIHQDDSSPAPDSCVEHSGGDNRCPWSMIRPPMRLTPSMYGPTARISTAELRILCSH